MDGLSNLLSGLAGTTPNTATTVGASVTELTGVGARSVGIAAGAVFVAVAILPKMPAVVLAMPGPVFAVYLGVLLTNSAAPRWLLQCADAVADGGGGDAELVGGEGEALVAGGGLEESQAVERWQGSHGFGRRESWGWGEKIISFVFAQIHFFLEPTHKARPRCRFALVDMH